MTVVKRELTRRTLIVFCFGPSSIEKLKKKKNMEKKEKGEFLAMKEVTAIEVSFSLMVKTTSGLVS